MAMFNYKLKAGEFKSSIISALAVLGLNLEEEGQILAMNYTLVLLAVVTITRGLVVYRVQLTYQKAIQEGVERGIEEREAKVGAPSIFKRVKDIVQMFITLTTFNRMPSLIDRILHIRTYSIKIRYSTKGEARVTQKGEEIYINKISFTIEELRSVVYRLNELVRQRLIEDLLYIKGEREVEGKAKLPKLDLKGLYNNLVELIAGQSFLNNYRSQQEVDSKKQMFKRLYKEADLEEKFIQRELERVERQDQIQQNQKGIEDYFRRVSRFKEELIALVHLIVGTLARGTEVLSIQHTNREGSQIQRGIFLEDRIVAFITRYYKGYSSS